MSEMPHHHDHDALLARDRERLLTRALLAEAVLDDLVELARKAEAREVIAALLAYGSGRTGDVPHEPPKNSPSHIPGECSTCFYLCMAGHWCEHGDTPIDLRGHDTPPCEGLTYEEAEQ